LYHLTGWAQIAIFGDMKNYENGKKGKIVQPKVVPNNQYFSAFE